VGAAWALILTIAPKATPSNIQVRADTWPPPNSRVPCTPENAPTPDLLDQRQQVPIEGDMAYIRHTWAPPRKKGQPVKVGLDSIGARMDAGIPDMVPGAGLEPARLAAGDFESPESTNFTTRAVFVKTQIMAYF
jgi:hypothetical protein